MVYCSLTDFQKAVYQTVLETEDVTLILQSSQPCTCSSGRKRRNCCYKVSFPVLHLYYPASGYLVLYSSFRVSTGCNNFSLNSSLTLEAF